MDASAFHCQSGEVNVNRYCEWYIDCLLQPYRSRQIKLHCGHYLLTQFPLHVCCVCMSSGSRFIFFWAEVVPFHYATLTCLQTWTKVLGSLSSILWELCAKGFLLDEPFTFTSVWLFCETCIWLYMQWLLYVVWPRKVLWSTFVIPLCMHIMTRNFESVYCTSWKMPLKMTIFTSGL